MRAEHPDVLVVGGGAAGVGAAVGAAQAGARVVLVERHAYLGGLATSALVGTICGLYHRRTDGAVAWAVEGFPREVGERVAHESRTHAMSWRHGLTFLPYEPFALRTVLDDVAEAAGVEVRLHHKVLSVQREGSRIVGVGLGSSASRSWWEPAQVVDTTGVASVARLGGIAVDEDPDYQAGAYVVSVCGLAPIDADALRLGVAMAVRRGIAAGALPQAALAMSVVPGSHRADRVYLKLGLPGRHTGAPEEVSALERQARRLMRQIVAHLVDAEPVFAHALVADAASQVGLRTGARVRGRSLLTEQDVLVARKYEDGVAPGAWPVEVWGDAPQPELVFGPEGQTYEVPAGALVSSDTENLRVGGRHLGGEARAVASARVIGTCLATGYAAGRLAAGAAAGRPEVDDVAFLRDHLITGRISA